VSGLVEIVFTGKDGVCHCQFLASTPPKMRIDPDCLIHSVLLPQPVVSHPALKVPDEVCPKCGSADVRVRYQEPGESPYGTGHKVCVEVAGLYRPEGKYGPVGDDSERRVNEHFHRHCQRCTYWWPDPCPEN
jgi:hypothetical protein